MKRMLFIVIVLAGSAIAMALTAYTKVFDDYYKVGKDSTLGKARCTVCHTAPKGGKQLNAYGQDLQKELKAAKTKKLTPDILKKVENMDSDKDGKKNIEEIRADSTPGA